MFFFKSGLQNRAEIAPVNMAMLAVYIGFKLVKKNKTTNIIIGEIKVSK